MMSPEIRTVIKYCILIILCSIVPPTSPELRFHILPEADSTHFRDVLPVSSEVHRPRARQAKRSLPENCSLLSLPIDGDIRVFCVFEEPLEASVNVVTSETIVDVGGIRSKLSDVGLKVARGYDIQTPQAGDLDGYLSDGRFFGKLHYGNDTYYLEPGVRFQKELNLSAELAENVTAMYKEAPRKASSWSLGSSSLETSSGVPSTQNNFTGRLCPMLMMADPVFVAESKGKKQAVIRMIKIAEEADAVLRNADWDNDGFPDNVGISLRYVVVQEAGDRRLLRHASRFSVDSRRYLIAFAASEPLLARVCLGAAFTQLQFSGRVLGVSFTSPPGGACEGLSLLRRPGVALNSLAVSSRSALGAVPARMLSLALAHEIGHSLGAPHDGDAAFGSSACPPGRFLMSPLSVNGSHVDHYRFSPCSRRAVRLTASKHRWRCLEPVTRPFCGNGLLEGSEECDCGLDVLCREFDRCCVPRGRSAGCRVDRAAGFACHPSLGPCCLCSCQFADLSHLGIDCRLATRLADSQCPCASEQGCSCGVLGQCVGSRCHAVECAVLKLQECECPAHNGSCRTCCRLADGDCITAADAALRLARGDAFGLQQLKKMHAALTESRGTAEDAEEVKACSLRGGGCVLLRFQRWPAGGPCVTRGRVGLCSLHGCQANQRVDVQKVCPWHRSGAEKCSNASLFLFLYVALFACSPLLKIKHVIFDTLYEKSVHLNGDRLSHWTLNPKEVRMKGGGVTYTEIRHWLKPEGPCFCAQNKDFSLKTF